MLSLSARITPHLYRGRQQDEAEDQESGGEGFQRGRAQGDEHAAQHQRSDDAVQQYPLLKSDRNGEGGQQEHENEQIVHRERLLDYISGKVLGAAFAPEPPPNESTERQRNRDVEQRPPRGLAGGDLVGAPG